MGFKLDKIGGIVTFKQHQKAKLKISFKDEISSINKVIARINGLNKMVIKISSISDDEISLQICDETIEIMKNWRMGFGKFLFSELTINKKYQKDIAYDNGINNLFLTSILKETGEEQEIAIDLSWA